MATLPAPIEAESFSVPGDHRFRFDDQQSRSPLTPESREPDSEEPVGGSQTHLVCAGRALKDQVLLMPKQESWPESRPEFEILAELNRAARK